MVVKFLHAEAERIAEYILTQSGAAGFEQFWTDIGAQVPKGYDIEFVQSWVTSGQSPDRPTRDKAKQRLMGGLPVAFWGYLHTEKPWDQPKYIDLYRTRMNDAMAYSKKTLLQNWPYPKTRLARGEFEPREEWGPHALTLIYHLTGTDE